MSRGRKYWKITTTQIVYSDTKTEALRAVEPVRNRRGVDAQVLSTEMHGEQILAGEAREELAQSA